MQVNEESEESNADDAADRGGVSTELLRRRGNVHKCPVCGSAVDAEAFHCPSCHSNFCFHCRGQLLPSDPQFQCVNQACDYYSKLICDRCDPQVEKDEPPATYIELEDGYWPGLLILVLLFATFVWTASSFMASLIFAVLTFAGGGYALHLAGINVFGRERHIEHPRTSICQICIKCGENVRQCQLD